MREMKFLALYRDLGASADGCSHSLGVFDTESDAQTCVRQDIVQYCAAILECQSKSRNRESVAVCCDCRYG